MMIRATFRQGNLRTVRDYLIPATVDGVRALLLDSDVFHSPAAPELILVALESVGAFHAGRVGLVRVSSR